MRRGCRALSRLVPALAFAALGGVGTAHAAGVEDTVTGTVALGRQAGTVRADDYQAIWLNPANLAVLSGKDVGLELRVPIFNASYTRYRNPAYEYLSTESFGKVENTASPVMSGSFGFSMPLPRGFGVGIGVYTPPGVAAVKFGNTAINTINVDPMTETLKGTSGVNETQGRYMLVERSQAAAWLMAGVGYSPIRQLRLGLSVGGGFSSAKFKNVSSLFGGTLTDVEVVSDVKVTDMYIPRAVFSVAATPIDSIDLLASLTYNGDTSSKGDVVVTANGYNDAPQRLCSAEVPGQKCKVKDVTLDVPYQRFEVLLGGRYASRRVKRERVLDPMKDEVWDVEVNALWTQTSHVDKYVLHIHDVMDQQRIQVASSTTATAAPLPTSATLVHNWKDTYGVRIGGDYNVIQNLLSVRAGFSFETAGVDKKYANLDYWPMQKCTIGFGASVKLGRWKIHAAYAHVFNQSVNVKVGQGALTEVVALMPAAAQVINEGKYRSSVDVFTLQGNVSF